MKDRLNRFENFSTNEKLDMDTYRELERVGRGRRDPKGEKIRSSAKELRIREQLKPFVGKQIKIKFKLHSQDWQYARRFYGDSYESIEPGGWLILELTGKVRQVGPIALAGTMVNGNRQRGKGCAIYIFPTNDRGNLKFSLKFAGEGFRSTDGGTAYTDREGAELLAEIMNSLDEDLVISRSSDTKIEGPYKKNDFPVNESEKTMKHLKLYENFDHLNEINWSYYDDQDNWVDFYKDTCAKLGIKNMDGSDMREMVRDEAAKYGDKGSSVLGMALMARKKGTEEWIRLVPQVAQGSMTNEHVFKLAEDFLSKKYPGLEFMTKYGNMD